MRQGHALRARARGVSLIELMVSLAIGLFLVLGATVVYVNSRKSADVDETYARLQETARYAMSVLEADTRMANYWGALKDGAAIENKKEQANTSAEDSIANLISSSSDCGTDFAVDVTRYIEATNNGYGSLTCSANTAEVGSADTLTIRRTGTAPTTLNNARAQLCVNRNFAKVITPSNTCPSSDEIYDLVVNTYYVDKASTHNSDYPSLRRKWLTTVGGSPGMADEEIIPGIEDMQVQLGWDSGTSGSAVRYVHPGDAVLATGQISVRVSLLVRAENPDPGYTDTNTYEYGDRLQTNGVTADLSDAGAAGKAYAPNDNFRRILVTRTFFVRNVTGT
jgi:type IV pilus assembly protein PilW